MQTGWRMIEDIINEKEREREREKPVGRLFRI